jgi:hypothetical protein
MGELIVFLSNVISISREVVGAVSDDESILGRGKVDRRRVYTSLGLNWSGSGGKSSKQCRILMSGNDATCVGNKY